MAHSSSRYTGDPRADLAARSIIITTSSTAGYTLVSGTTSLAVDAVTANHTIDLGSTTATDVLFNGATAGADIRWDASADQLIVTNAASVRFGAAADGFVFDFDAADSLNIDPANASDVFRIGETTIADFRVDCTTAAADLILDASANTVQTPRQLEYMGTVTTDATVGAITYTAAMLLGGIILRDPAGGARADLMPTAAALLAVMPSAAVGSVIKCYLVNTADAAEAITVTQDAGATITVSNGATHTVGQGEAATLLIRFTNVTAAAEAAVCYVVE